MPHEVSSEDDDSQPLTDETLMSPRSSSASQRRPRTSSSASSASIILENLNGHDPLIQKHEPYKDDDAAFDSQFEELDVEDGPMLLAKPASKAYKKWLYVLGIVCAIGWLLALGLFVRDGSYQHRSSRAHDPNAKSSLGSGKRVTLGQVQMGFWRARSQAISWIEGPHGEDGLLLEEGSPGKDYLVVEDIRSTEGHAEANNTITLMKTASFETDLGYVNPIKFWPSPDLSTVLCMSDRKQNWRHSSTGLYWLFDVKSQTGQALDPDEPHGRIQLATWSPTSDAVVFTRENNMYLRKLQPGGRERSVTQITQDGGVEKFNGVPDWVYEEEVFSGNSATWYSPDGKYIAFLATDESEVPEYPVQYFLSRPTGNQPADGEQNYPDVRRIKYPKAGAPNPIVSMRYYDVVANKVFDVSIKDDFSDTDRLITEAIWAGNTGKILIRQTNRESDVLKMVLVDAARRESKIVRQEDVNALDGGWFEVSETTTFVPSDPANGRPHDGYIDTIIHQGYDHLGYFSPLDNPDPKILTSGQWEVVDAPSAIDVDNNLVYFIATKESSIQRHVYKVGLDGSGLEPITDTSEEAYYEAHFSKAAGYAVLSYEGPDIPWQKVVSTPSTDVQFEHTLEDNKDLAKSASAYELPIKVYQTVKIDGFELNVVERRPPHFDPRKSYPVLFQLYGGPGSQQVDKKFAVDFQSFVASNLGYVVVTVDGRGTGFLGRATRCIIRSNIGHYEALDQIETAKIWAQKPYVDSNRMAIWGWSYGGYLTLKTLEQDAGQTFKYGMAVAPVTDWVFYGKTQVTYEIDPPLTSSDTIYTERWMQTPQNNPSGYLNASISNVTALAQNTRFLIMHGVADDNVHFQNTLTLLDAFDKHNIENYDVHVFPDSDHSIYFHNANRIVYDKLRWWLINAFNGEWARIQDAVPAGRAEASVVSQ
ncbi:MAG: hypothetical protein M1828_006314 [Chrysothrix sp. TS-e1954]|nr:MAG: hypothetical protein M1828_006314 [Chrysothrix sp. TS-e1954]